MRVLRRCRGDRGADLAAPVTAGVPSPCPAGRPPRLDDALEAAITLAEEEDEYAGAGVLVTGSVITAGEARLLLGPE